MAQHVIVHTPEEWAHRNDSKIDFILIAVVCVFVVFLIENIYSFLQGQGFGPRVSIALMIMAPISIILLIVFRRKPYFNKLLIGIVVLFLLVIFVPKIVDSVRIENNKDYFNDFDKLRVCMTYDQVASILGPAYESDERRGEYSFKDGKYVITTLHSEGDKFRDNKVLGSATLYDTANRTIYGWDKVKTFQNNILGC